MRASCQRSTGGSAMISRSGERARIARVRRLLATAAAGLVLALPAAAAAAVKAPAAAVRVDQLGFASGADEDRLPACAARPPVRALRGRRRDGHRRPERTGAETKIAYLLALHARPAAAFRRGRRRRGRLQRSCGRQPRPLEHALRRRSAARPERADGSGDLPDPGTGPAGRQLAALPHRQPGQPLPRPRGRHRRVFQDSAMAVPRTRR